MASRGQATNRKAALAYWLALPHEKRSHLAVAQRFGVSRQRIQQIATEDEWSKRLDELEEAEAAEAMRDVRRAVRRQARSRAERIAQTLEAYDRSNDLLLGLLPIKADGTIDEKALDRLGDRPLDRLLGHLPGLHRMAELAAGEATDRLAVTEVQPVLIAFAKIAVFHAPPEERPAVMRELADASSGLIPLEQAV